MTSIPPSLNAAAEIVTARRLAQIDQDRIGNLGAYRAEVRHRALAQFSDAWRRLLATDPYLDGLQLANAVEPIDPPQRTDPLAAQQGAERARADINAARAHQAPTPDRDINAEGLARARAALRQGAVPNRGAAHGEGA